MASPRERLPQAEFKCLIQKHSVDQKLEDQWMIRYTKIYTRELVFAVDITNFVMNENQLHFQNFIFPNCLGRRCASDFDVVMQTYVAMTWRKRATAIQEGLEEDVDMQNPSYVDFKAYVNSYAVNTESAVFEGCGFLIFSVAIAHLCALAFKYGMPKAPDFGIMIMCRLHSHFRMKGLFSQNMWVELKEAAKQGILMYTLESLNAVNEISFCL